MTMEYPINKEIEYDPKETAKLRKELREHISKKYPPQINSEMYEILKKAHRGGHTHCAIEERRWTNSAE